MDKGAVGKEKKVLYMQTFGGFSLSYDGRQITGSRESQFVSLMQVLLHERRQGVSRDRLTEVLFGDRDVEDVHHAVRSVIYNAKKRLQNSGLPKVNYIVRKDGVYHWTEEVPVEEDAEKFEYMFDRAEAEEDEDVRLTCYLDACYCCRGEFLPAYGGTLWAAQEARRYRVLFRACVWKTVELLRSRQDFRQMEQLGRYAAKISPLSDWETVTMEALTALGSYEEARAFYDRTAELYFREQGLMPSERMTELLGKTGSQTEHPYGSMHEIQQSLSKGETAEGGYLCSYPVFQGIYRMVRRMTERGGQSVYLMLCRIVDGRGERIREEQALEMLTKRLENAVQNSVRKGDAMSRYGKGQYLVLLVNIAYEDCDLVKERISRRFAGEQIQAKIRYYVNSVTGCAPGKKED